MKNRILDTSHGQFAMREWDGQNGSGIRPLCDKVIVLVDVAVERTSGGIILPDQKIDQQTLSSTTGIMVAVGPQAFVWNSDRTSEWTGDRPVAGTRVCFERYAGQEYPGADGNLYRVMQDRSIGGDMGPAVVTKAKAKAA